jgi:acyl-CoA reductase-like NAD-dependent aldehyde dehydrogenase
MRRMAPYERRDVLNHCVVRFQERFDELALSLCVEAGKPIKDAKGEVSRLIDTFRIAAEESVRMTGEVMNLEIAPRARRLPVGLDHGAEGRGLRWRQRGAAGLVAHVCPLEPGAPGAYDG